MISIVFFASTSQINASSCEKTLDQCVITVESLKDVNEKQKKEIKTQEEVIEKQKDTIKKQDELNVLQEKRIEILEDQRSVSIGFNTIASIALLLLVL